MAVDVRLATFLLVFISPTIFAQERCGYMIAIPREPRPNLPELNFEGQTWSQRPLLPAPDREDLCMDGYHVITATLGTQVIYMEEEIEGEITIAILNYNGPSTPFIESPFLSGSFNLLMPVIRRVPANGGEWHLIITQRQDYETPGMQQYMFNIRVEDQALVAGVSLLIVNIDDNPPIIQNFGACQVAELGEPGLTECIYQVSDADGRISTQFMTFRIDSDRGDAETFYIEGTNIPNEWMWLNMTVGLRTPLNFETNPLHIFSVTASDSLPNNHTVTMMVQVQNVNSRPPRWLEIFAVQQFDEKSYQNFTVRAIDGDTGIDMPINYRLITAEEDTFFSIETLPGGRSGAIFHVQPIDRDTLQREVFQLTIVAYKFDEEAFSTPTNVVIIVNDINDQKPEPLEDEYHLAIMEETPMTLNFDKPFGFHDRDLGQNAQYTVHLESVEPPGAADAFYIAPEVGYQRQTFIMGTLNHSMLDYEVPEFQHITIKVVAIDNNDTSHVGVAMVHIDLINWNDEQPIFEHSVQTVSFNETEGEGFHVATALANDRDIGDRVEHALLGNAVNYLTIDEDTGDIYVSANDSFDYHRQSELFVQIRATDTLGEPFHTVTSQLVIQLIDINNTPPTLRLPRGSPQVEENVPEGEVISEAVRATDPDTTAELRFEINWDTSYATKQGRETDPIHFKNCVEIETIYPEINNRGLAIGRVVVREIRYNVTIDYEEFEMLYLTVRVRDLNTVYGDDYDESTFTITIIDMNDNWPLWVEGSLEQQFRVREVSPGGVVVGSVRADDIDGPLYNQVRYTMYPREDTDEDLMMIDFLTGQITVNTSGAIDADTPPRYHLYYTVVASDKCSTADPDDCPPDPTYWRTEGNITIDITDTNNKIPQPEAEEVPVVVYIYENATHLDEVVVLGASDLDRDRIYHTVSYVINFAVNPRLRNFFSIDRETGLLYVDYTTDEVLDRDGDEPQHHIFINLIDNFFGDGEGNRNQNDTEVLVVLLDVNDNAPELPPPNELSWSISENLQEGVRLQPEIYAPDRDEPDTDNSRVGYEILNLSTDRDIVVPELFTMIQIQNVTGELETAMNLRGYWGTYAIHIRAFDHGIPQQSSNETYELVIRPYNFHAPVFVFPTDGAIIRLARERAVVNGVLASVDGEFLERVSATDDDGLHAGIVTFQVVGDAESETFFQIVNDGENLGSLRLLQMFTEEIREFRVMIRGTDQGTEPGPQSTDITVRLVFVPTQGEPTFGTSQHTVGFIEQSAGMDESHELPLAQDAKNHLCSDDCHSIYYRIIDGNSDGYFGLDPVRNVLFLEKELDRDKSAVHTLQVAASNSPEGGIPLAASILTITVNVREADPRPVFVREVYTAGISVSDSIGRELLTVHATQSEGAAVTYTIDHATMVVDPTLEGVRLSAFVLNPQTGLLNLNIQPTGTMHGMFNFQVVATDTAGATDRTNVTVYIVSSQNRVYFVFINTMQHVEDNRDFIADTFTAGFNMICNIDQVLPANDPVTGVALDYSTQVRGHFIRDNVPVHADEIEQIRSDLVLLSSIQTTLATRLLVLQDLLTGSSPDAGSDSNQLTVYVLAALSALLAFMCLVLLLTFIIRTRALNRRLEALSMTKYGSQDSGLNRAGIAAPGTNKHTVEGSNPIFNEAIKTPDLDATSEGSNDSDLIGIEDLPHFGNFFTDPDTNERANGYPSSIANHNNNFAFNPTPFSPEFVNGQFRKI